MNLVIPALFLCVFIFGLVWAIKTGSLQEPTEKPSGLRWLPMAFYVIACLGFVAFLILAVQAESGYLFGYGIGATIACLGSGRVIELLQIIADELQQKRLSE